jgi:hypothetical protein
MIVHCSFVATGSEGSLVAIPPYGQVNVYSLECLVRTLRDTFTVNTDDSLQEFTQAFTELKVRFRERVDLDSWKIACTMRDGVIRLATRTDRLTEIGKRQVISLLSTF